MIDILDKCGMQYSVAQLSQVLFPHAKCNNLVHIIGYKIQNVYLMS